MPLSKVASDVAPSHLLLIFKKYPDDYALLNGNGLPIKPGSPIVKDACNSTEADPELLTLLAHMFDDEDNKFADYSYMSSYPAPYTRFTFVVLEKNIKLEKSVLPHPTEIDDDKWPTIARMKAKYDQIGAGLNKPAPFLWRPHRSIEVPCDLPGDFPNYGTLQQYEKATPTVKFPEPVHWKFKNTIDSSVTEWVPIDHYATGLSQSVCESDTPETKNAANTESTNTLASSTPEIKKSLWSVSSQASEAQDDCETDNDHKFSEWSNVSQTSEVQGPRDAGYWGDEEVQSCATDPDDDEREHNPFYSTDIIHASNADLGKEMVDESSEDKDCWMAGDYHSMENKPRRAKKRIVVKKEKVEENTMW